MSYGNARRFLEPMTGLTNGSLQRFQLLVNEKIGADLTDALIFHPNVGTITECTGAIYDGASTQQQVSGVCFHFICLQ